MRIFLIALFWSAGFGTIALGQSKPAPFENEIEAFEKEDQTTPPPKKALLFTGSSSIRLWPDLPTYFPGKVVLQRGFGGSTLTDLIHFTDRVIVPYKPKQVIVYSGENDAASGTLTAEQLFDRFVTLFTQVRKELPKTPFVYISMKPSPSRRKVLPVVQGANALIKAYLAKQRRTTFVDVYTPMLGADGQPRPELFKADSLHMTPKGYEVWAEQLKPVLK